MEEKITERHTEHLLRHGYAIVPNFLDAREVEAARTNMLRYFPTAEELAATPERYGSILKDPEHLQVEFPFAGDIPILGTLFRSNGFTHDQTELVIVVTPHLVTARRGQAATPGDNFTPPSDFERFLFGWQEGVGRRLKPEDRALISADPSKGGVDGPYGHVLY